MIKIKNLIVGFFVGLINGFFASGGGIIAVLALKHFFKIEEKKAHATAVAIILPLSIVSILFYNKAGYVDYNIVVRTGIGGIIGGIIGANLLDKIPQKYLKIGFGCIMIIAAVRMWQ